MGPRSVVRLPLRTPRLCLRLPNPDDVNELSTAGNSRAVARGTYVPYPFTRAKARQVVAKRRRETRAGRSLGLVILDRSTNRPIGMIGLGGIDRHDRNAELYYWLTADQWGRGLASEAAGAVLGIAFGPLALHRLTAHVHTFNSRSYGLLRHLGFRKEGRLREARPEGRHWHDVLVLGLLGDEFRAGRPRPHRGTGARPTGRRTPTGSAARPPRGDSDGTTRAVSARKGAGRPDE